MKLEFVEIENYRAVDGLQLPIHPSLTVFHGDNAHGKTSVLSAIAVGLGKILEELPGVKSIGFRKPDPRRVSDAMRISLTTTDGVTWIRRRQTAGGLGSQIPPTKKQPLHLRERIAEIVRADREGRPVDLPIVAFYDTERAVVEKVPLQRYFGKEFTRFTALEGALSARANFRDFAEWFYAWENEELREQKRRRDFDYHLKELDTVRRAIASMVPGVSDLHIEHRPRRIMVCFRQDSGKTETLSLDQLSGGYRIVLAVAGDLARRMAHGNPHLPDPLASEAIVLIDEIELHLHPLWQQRILADLARTFPNTQFIVSTHSPQVLTTVKPEHVVELRRERGGIVAEPASAPTYGAEAGDVLATVMGVDERPGGNEFAKKLARYTDLVADGKGESPRAVSLRKNLDELSPRDPALDRADIEIRRRKLLERMGKSQ